MANLGKTLRIIGTFDAHHKWDDAFIKETVTAANMLKQNERLEGPMMAKSGSVSAEVQVVIIRVQENEWAVRAVTSNKLISDAIESAIK